MDFLLALDAPPPPRKVEPPANTTASSLFELDAPQITPRADAAAALPATTPINLFEVDAPVVAPRPAPAPPAAPPPKRSTMEFMSELDTGAPETAAAGDQRSTMELTFEVDAAPSAISREIDLATEPEVAGAIDAAVAEEAAADSDGGTDVQMPEAEPAQPPVVVAHVDLSAFQTATADEKAKTPEAQHELRVQRSVQRVIACRETFRLLGLLAIAEEDRKTLARMLMELDTAVGRAENAPSVVKEPEAVLQSATHEQLDAIERLLGPIEDKLLYLDEGVVQDAFRARVESSKQPKKVMARYARLLASRRFQAGARRDRFEWIATQLLTATDADGMRKMMAPERARSVLQHVIGGMPRKANEQETAEAITYLQDALVRVSTVSEEEFFDGGVFLDVHGYKVSMRDQLLVPEFVYLSVLINAAVHNRLEAWIADRDRLHLGNQLTAEGSPREHIMRRVREAEEAVDDLFSVKRRGPAQARAAEPAKPATPGKKKGKEKQKKTRSFLPTLDIVIDRQLILFVGALLVIGATGLTIAFQTGAIGAQQLRALKDGEIAGISPFLASAWVAGSGDDSRLDATIRDGDWQALDPRKKTVEAERISKLLMSRQIPSANITNRHGGQVITIEKGFVSFVQGGKL